MAKLIAKFSQDKTSGDFPVTIKFKGASTPKPQSRWWDFGDGCYSTDQNPNHTFYEKGDFDVSLFVRKDGTDNIFSTDTKTTKIKAKAGYQTTKYGKRGERSYPPLRENPTRPTEIVPGKRGDRTDPIKYF